MTALDNLAAQARRLRDLCPNGHDLQGSPIPEDVQHLYGTTHYSRGIGHELRGVYDGVLFYSCPDCGLAWQRFTIENTIQPRLSKASADAVIAWNANIV